MRKWLTLISPRKAWSVQGVTMNEKDGQVSPTAVIVHGL